MARAARRSALAALVFAFATTSSACSHGPHAPTGPGPCIALVTIDGLAMGEVTALPGTVLQLAVGAPAGVDGPPTWTSTGGTLSAPADGPDGSSAIALTLPASEGTFVVRADWGNGCAAALSVTASHEIAMDAGDENPEAGEPDADVLDEDAATDGAIAMDAKVDGSTMRDVPVAMDVRDVTDTGTDTAPVDAATMDSGAMDDGATE